MTSTTRTFSFVQSSRQACLRTQPFVFYHRGHLGNEWPTCTFAFTCTFYYHTYMLMISCDGQFFILFRYEIPHITYHKFNTGISNKLASQHERTIAIKIMGKLFTCRDEHIKSTKTMQGRKHTRTLSCIYLVYTCN